VWRLHARRCGIQLRVVDGGNLQNSNAIHRPMRAIKFLVLPNGDQFYRADGVGGDAGSLIDTVANGEEFAVAAELTVTGLVYDLFLGGLEGR